MRSSPRSVSDRATKLGDRLLEWSPRHWTVGLIFAAAVFIYLWPVLIAGKVLTPSTLLYMLAPWEPFRPPDLNEWRNPLLSDAATDFQPWLKYARESLLAGVFPAWNPFVFAGTPFFANPQTAMLSPFNLPVWPLPFPYSLGVAAALKLWAAGFGMYLLIRELRLGPWPALFAGLAFAFCGFNIVWLSHPHVNVVVVLPLILWAAERVVRRGQARDGLFLTLALGVALLGGHPGSQLHVVLALAVYAGIRLVVSSSAGLRRERLRKAALIGLATVVAGLLAAVVLIPAVLLIPGSARSVSLGDTWALPPSSLVTLAFPDFWGRPSGQANLQYAVNFNERTLYAGTVALLLALTAVANLTGWREKGPFAALGLLGLGVAMGVPPLVWLFSNAPLLDKVSNTRLLFLFQFGVAVLAAFGLQHLLEGSRRVLTAVGIALVAGAVAFGAISWLSPPGAALQKTLEHFVTGDDFRGARVVRLVAVTWWLGLGLALAFVVWRVKALGFMALALIALLAIDLAHFARGYQPMPPSEHAFPPTPPSVRFLQREDRGERITAIGEGYPLFPDAHMLYGLRDIRGHDPPEPSLRYGRILAVAGALGSGNFITELTPGGKRVLDVLGVRYVLLAPESPPLNGDGLSRAYAGTDATVYRNISAAPRTYVPRVTRPVQNLDSAISAIEAPGFDPRSEAAVEVGPGRAADVSPAKGTVRIAAESNSSVEVDARLSRGGLVVLNEIWKDGWNVTVDGRPAAAFPVNGVLRGVAVPAGAHKLQWSYVPPGLRAGAIASGLTVTGIVLGLVGRRIRRGRARTGRVPAAA